MALSSKRLMKGLAVVGLAALMTHRAPESFGVMIGAACILVILWTGFKDSVDMAHDRWTELRAARAQRRSVHKRSGVAKKAIGAPVRTA